MQSFESVSESMITNNARNVFDMFNQYDLVWPPYSVYSQTKMNSDTLNISHIIFTIV